MNVEVHSGIPAYEDMPAPVYILLIGDDGQTKGAIQVYPRKLTPDKPLMRIEVVIGNISLKPPIQFEVDVEM